MVSRDWTYTFFRISFEFSDLDIVKLFFFHWGWWWVNVENDESKEWARSFFFVAWNCTLIEIYFIFRSMACLSFLPRRCWITFTSSHCELLSYLIIYYSNSYFTLYQWNSVLCEIIGNINSSFNLYLAIPSDHATCLPQLSSLAVCCMFRQKMSYFLAIRQSECTNLKQVSESLEFGVFEKPIC